MKHNIGLNIKQLCINTGMSQGDIAKLVGKTAAVISSYVNGTNPPIEVIIKICDEFHLSLDEFVKGKLSNTTEIDLGKDQNTSNEIMLLSNVNSRLSVIEEKLECLSKTLPVDVKGQIKEQLTKVDELYDMAIEGSLESHLDKADKLLKDRSKSTK